MSICFNLPQNQTACVKLLLLSPRIRVLEYAGKNEPFGDLHVASATINNCDTVLNINSMHQEIRVLHLRQRPNSATPVDATSVKLRPEGIARDCSLECCDAPG